MKIARLEEDIGLIATQPDTSGSNPRDLLCMPACMRPCLFDKRSGEQFGDQSTQSASRDALFLGMINQRAV